MSSVELDTERSTILRGSTFPTEERKEPGQTSYNSSSQAVSKNEDQLDKKKAELVSNSIN